jgi:hypothetical protein
LKEAHHPKMQYDTNATWYITRWLSYHGLHIKQKHVYTSKETWYMTECETQMSNLPKSIHHDIWYKCNAKCIGRQATWLNTNKAHEGTHQPRIAPSERRATKGPDWVP